MTDLGGGEFSGTCPKDHYIDLDDPKGGDQYCCKACPAGTHTRGNGNAQKAGGISPCGNDPNNCPANKNVIDINNNCYPCEFPRSLKLSNDDDCSTTFCDGTKGDGWTRFKETINGKTSCNRACEASKPLRDKDGHCHSCDTHEQVDVEGVEDNCNICDGSNDTTKHKRTLANVSTWWYWGAGNGKGSYCHFDCPKDKFLSIENSTKKCISCDDPEPHTASKESCTTCSERISNGNTCLLKSQDCEDGYTMDTSRKCTSCDQKTPFYVATEQLCTERCPQRTFHPIKQKTPRGEYVVKQYLCMLPCPPTAPLQNSDGDCFPCNDENINSGKLNKLELPCKEICENRHKVSSFCLPQCPKDTPLLERISTNTTTGSYKKYCHSCNDPTEIRTTYSDDCSVCPNRRKLVGSDGINVCVLPSQCKENEVLATDGKCYPCDSDMLDIYFGDNLSGPQQCRTCKNRRILSKHCVLRCPENKPIMIGFYQDKPITGYDQFCVSCDSSDDILTPYYSSDCSVCDGHNNTTHKKRLSSGNGRYCMICPNDSLVALDNKQCLACNDPLSIKVSSEDIQNIHKICNGSNSTTRAERTYERSNDNDSYFPYISIPCTNRPLRDQQLRCIPCDYDAAIPDTNDETLKLCPKKRYINTNASYPCKKSIAGELSPTQCSQCGYTWKDDKCQ